MDRVSKSLLGQIVNETLKMINTLVIKIETLPKSLNQNKDASFTVDQPSSNCRVIISTLLITKVFLFETKLLCMPISLPIIMLK